MGNHLNKLVEHRLRCTKVLRQLLHSPSPESTFEHIVDHDDLKVFPLTFSNNMANEQMVCCGVGQIPASARSETLDRAFSAEVGHPFFAKLGG
jgi:hypothetical protein